MTITIDGRQIGDGHKPYIIAEAADAHMGNMDYAKALVRMAASCGADAIKFQHHLPDEEMLPDSGPMADNLPAEGLYQWLKTHAFTLDQHREIATFCKQEGITYLCTPFSWQAALDINDLVPAFKIGSGEAQDFPTLRRIASLGKPLIVSTGMCHMDEVAHLTTILDSTPHILMHCVSEYPPKAQDLNLKCISRMREFIEHVGYSSHWPGTEDAIMAMAMGACVIEKHVSLTRHLDGPDASVSISGQQLGDIAYAAALHTRIMGSSKEVHEAERPVRDWAYRSLVIIKDMRAGELITQDHIWSKRPGTGIPAKRMAEFIGQSVRHDVPANTLLREDMLQ